MIDHLITFWVLPTLSVAVVLALLRLIKGPDVANRVMALDVLTVLGIGLIAAYAIAHRQPAFLDAAILLAVLSFLTTIAFAYYLERGTEL